ncbi:MAG TPA: pyruvate kinase [Candidatus Limnocylindria bacterium]|nr:pyruvate kinase [Candidatus Limnocylindria bacterium]
MRRTKLVCTIGPASRYRIDELVAAGMDVARLNFSHGAPAQHRASCARVRAAADAAGRHVAVLADLPGPKIRLTDLPGGQLELATGASFWLGPDYPRGAPGEHAGTTYPHLVDDLRPGDRVMLADGAVELRVASVQPGWVESEVVRGGKVRSGAGVNVPSERLSLPAVTDRDRAALRAVLTMDVDFVAQSFVRSADDVRELRRAMGRGARPIVAKLETRAAIEHLEDLLAVVQGVMLARGDLGVELPFAEVPIIQKQVIGACVASGIPVIVATQMLESMVSAPRPTRAEASDAANAVLDGADAVMLSAETAIGDYPVLAAGAAAAICETAERQGEAFGQRHEVRASPEESEPAAVAHAAVALARQLSEPAVSAIACFTQTGLTARLLAALRPAVTIHALTPDAVVARRLALWRGVAPIATRVPGDTDDLIALVEGALPDAGVPAGSLVVIAGSIPFGKARSNFVKLHRLPDGGEAPSATPHPI